MFLKVYLLMSSFTHDKTGVCVSFYPPVDTVQELPFSIRGTQYFLYQMTSLEEAEDRQIHLNMDTPNRSYLI